MKKTVLFGFLLAIASIMATGCSSCGSANKQDAKILVQADYDGVAVDFNHGVDHIVALHRQTMFSLVDGQQYEWRNLQVLFSDSIKLETIDDLRITDITSVFYYWTDGPWVQYITSNVDNGMLIPARIPDVWIEDYDLSEAEIKLWPEDVLSRLKEFDGIIPPAKAMVLRMPIGPRRCNAQWVIGGIGDPLFIDAVTGDIVNWCPAFPVPNVEGPLGECP